VLVADHHAVFRAALREVIAATPSFEQVAEAASFAETLRLAAALRPDLALLDERLFEVGAPEALRRLRDASPRTVAVLMTLDREPEGQPAAAALEHVRKQALSPRTLQRLWGRSRRGPQPAAR
jgi:DNA-binding NarL/FixJ family response regulator